MLFNFNVDTINLMRLCFRAVPLSLASKVGVPGLRSAGSLVYIELTCRAALLMVDFCFTSGRKDRYALLAVTLVEGVALDEATRPELLLALAD